MAVIRCPTQVVKLLIDLLPSADAADDSVTVEPSVPSAEVSQDPVMVSPDGRQLLQQQGYRLVGSHSAIKQCRWTKSAMLGEGQCYKHTFYGINSHRCMEGTPSLACANKCTFCWRGHANPVTTSWTYQTDDPKSIVSESIARHLELVENVPWQYAVSFVGMRVSEFQWCQRCQLDKRTTRSMRKNEENHVRHVGAH